MSKVRIACLSDLHGNYPDIPECDLLVLAGDYCAGGDVFTRMQHYRDLRLWVSSQYRLGRVQQVVGIAGNHDFLFEKAGYDALPQIDWIYLQDSGTVWNGLKIWGTPWQPRFFDWAFNLDEHALANKWALIPNDTDILVVHGPPHGIGDFSPFGEKHVGSPSLRQRILEVKPKLVVCGHIHSGYGQYQLGESLVVNSSLVDERYQVSNPVQVIELEAAK